MSVPVITLNNGVQIPQVGYGVFQVPAEETQRAVEAALEVGYRHIDTAAGYDNEEGVGAALRAVGLPREDVFVTTKVRNKDHGFEETLAAFDASSTALRLDVVDLYLIHWPVPSKDGYVQTWRALEKLHADGAARSVGVSNFLPEHLERLRTETDVVPAVNQVEVHPGYQNRAVADASAAAGVAVEAYSPLGRGAALTKPAVTGAADELGVTPAQVVLRWHVQHGRIVIPKSVTPERVAANIDLFGFELDEDQMAAIDALDAGERTGGDPATMDLPQG
ncbi:aldo/keto reductase [Georgenia sp. H159]|uniref:aldo/keto reductase n=1 Tax=Georgenia sp. H159 TaxID=3076115 RepID=UPI002D783CEC|nr:aldo/keto reductase [Georgenia sp. H159]